MTLTVHFLVMFMVERYNAYITYEIVRPETLSFTIATANVWDKHDVLWYGFIDHVFRQVNEKIPVGGTILRFDDGAMAFYRNSKFLSYLDEPNDRLVTRGIIRYIVKSYIL